MALPAKALIVILHTFVWSLIGTFRVSHGTSSDISCLKSIKASLDDPYGYLNSSWDFNNNTEGFICEFRGVGCWHEDENNVFNITLSDLGLKGQFPWGIEKCKNLIVLDLSNNELSGPLPFDIAKRVKYVTKLDLSSNKFSGEIPSSIADCSYLNILKLDDNRLTGHIPQQLGRLSRIKTFNVSSNLLSGKVPNFVNVIIKRDSYANNTGLCGLPLKPCKKHKNRMKFDDSFQGGFVVGYVVSLVSVLTIFVSYCLPWEHVKKKSKIMMTPMMTAFMEKKSKKIKEADKGGISPSVKLLQNWSKQISTLERVVFRMSFTELSQATDDFSEGNIIGTGNMGTMYKAMLSNGWFLAVKRIHDYQQFKRQFVCEVMILGRLRHTNLVPLLGFSIERKERLLIYKFMSKGSLYDQLHPAQSGPKIMEWPQRVKIAIGIARGLAWLHHCCDIRVVHLNLCSKCILLDQKFEPKISNFGDSLFMNPNEAYSDGSFIMNSDFWDFGFVKKDVHSFGIVLLELITGKDPRQVENSSTSTHLSSSSSGFNDAVDKSLIGQGFDGEIVHFLRVASNCVQPFPDQRPTMLEVYKTLRAVGERYGLADDSEMLTQGHMVPANTRDGYIRVQTTERQ